MTTDNRKGNELMFFYELQSLYLSFGLAEKPAWFTAEHKTIIETLLQRLIEKAHTFKHRQFTVRMSEDELARLAHTSKSTLKRRFKDLEDPVKGQMVTVKSGKSTYHENEYTVRLGSLPTSRYFKKAMVISVQAYNIAGRYLKLVRALPKRPSRTNPQRMVSQYRKDPGHMQRWELLAQEWLDMGFTETQVNALCDAGLKLVNHAYRGMHVLRSKLKFLMRVTGMKPGETPPNNVDAPINLPHEPGITI